MAGDGSSEGFRLQDYRPKEDTDGEESRRLQVDGEDGGEQQEPEPETLSELRHDSASVSSSSATMAGGFVTPVSAAVQAVAELMENSTEQLPGSARSKLQNQEKVAVSDQKISVNAALPFVSKMQNELQSSGCPPSPRNLSPTSVTQSNLAATLSEQRLRVVPVDGDFLPEAEHIVSSDQRIASTVPGGKSPSADGYNWRKYGQKQVKIPKGHRSYYRCTSSDCHAKKIECCNHVGSIVEVVYKDTHNHEVPNRSSMNRASKPTSVRNSITDRPITMLNNTELSTPSKDTRLEASSIPERKRQFASGSDETTEVNVDEPEPKRRLKHCSSAYSCSALKPGKKPKFVIRAAGDVGNSSDGYRWRKYGQKMVKGNPHPRNYYKCTSAGCPVRKHIERAVDNPSALIITYKGLHDHDTPVPKNQQAPPSPNLVLAVAPVSAFQNQKPPVDKGETVTQELDLGGGEKAIDSARTFLSIGFEIKPC